MRVLVESGVLLGLLIALAAVGKNGYTAVTASDRVAAIGDMSALPEPLRRALEPDDGFEPLPLPGPNDWLAEHPEPGEPFDLYSSLDVNRPSAARRRIYLLPLGAFPRSHADLLDRLTTFSSAYFTLETVCLPPQSIDKGVITSRKNPYTGQRQLLTLDILDLLRKRLPDDAYCLLAITMEDLYPDPAWNFVFGQAHLRDRVGVYSLARYDPAFYGELDSGDAEQLILTRSCKVLAHETAHMFGLMHCVYFRCLVNGSNHLDESDASPLHLCPVCLRKLQWCAGFDVTVRYRRLARVYQEFGLTEEAEWVTRRLDKIAGEP
jgi:archaemetzincin